MRESYIEKKACEYARKAYAIISYKQGGPGYRNRPDRAFLVPGGHVFFIEFKQTGRRPTPGQEREIQKLRNFGFMVEWCDTLDGARKAIDYAARKFHVTSLLLPGLPGKRLRKTVGKKHPAKTFQVRLECTRLGDASGVLVTRCAVTRVGRGTQNPRRERNAQPSVASGKSRHRRGV